jgi:hypothetical protein
MMLLLLLPLLLLLLSIRPQPAGMVSLVAAS